MDTQGNGLVTMAASQQQSFLVQAQDPASVIWIVIIQPSLVGPVVSVLSAASTTIDVRSCSCGGYSSLHSHMFTRLLEGFFLSKHHFGLGYRACLFEIFKVVVILFSIASTGDPCMVDWTIKIHHHILSECSQLWHHNIKFPSIVDCQGVINMTRFNNYFG